MDPKQIVRTGYDKVSYAYRSERGGAFDSPYADWLDHLHLPDGAAVLELGCGCGLPIGRMLAPRVHYLGVDISPVQIERARQLVPPGRFMCADMAELSFESGSFDAIISLYAIIHLPLAEQPPLFPRMSDWLRPGGQLLITTGSRAWTGTEQDWLDVAGATMYWSHADAAAYRQWLAGAGFAILRDEFVPEGTGGHQLFQARKRQIELRPAGQADKGFARTVHHLAYRDVVIRQFGQWDEALQDTFFARDWAMGGFSVILIDGIACGYTAIEDRSDDIHVREMVIHPDQQGRGIGSTILNQVLVRARQRCVPVRLGVLSKNRARILYKRLGFREFDRTDTHVLMEYRSP